MSGFPWKEHTATSVLTCKHLNATLCQCKCLRACLYKAHASRGGYVSLRGVRSDLFFFLFSFSLPLTSIPDLGEAVVTASVAVQVLSCLLCRQKVSVNSGLYLQGSSLSASGAQELWPFNSTFNCTLVTGRRWQAYILVPEGVQTGVKADGKSMSDDYSWVDSFFHMFWTWCLSAANNVFTIPKSLPYSSQLIV